ncbi:thiamine phosphate synthase [Pararoseomonas indoligenes]|uniref:Thiamine phosphate synthase n=1 Tax=Roseomonas indoligenes TaxID=2820811 RepID=A0A940S6V4_9PROT|nr:thiamine phosphate synthase [Pararoseomonas indoligenes]MBP0494305.1 thiamine phosphate synthase [Pararoseomonas indoligenes]
MRWGRLGQNGRSRNGRGIPALWLLSDARRLPDPRAAAARLPRGSAVLARDLAPGLLRPLSALARRRGLALVVAGDGRAALALRAGLHLPDRRPAKGLLPFLVARRGTGGGGLLSVAAHGRAGIARARRLRADLVILSPVFPTASHPGAPALGPLRWAALARRAGRPAVALGGVNALNSRRLPRLAAGWGAIGGLSRHTPVAAWPQCFADVAIRSFAHGRPGRH